MPRAREAAAQTHRYRGISGYGESRRGDVKKPAIRSRECHVRGRLHNTNPQLLRNLDCGSAGGHWPGLDKKRPLLIKRLLWLPAFPHIEIWLLRLPLGCRSTNPFRHGSRCGDAKAGPLTGVPRARETAARTYSGVSTAGAQARRCQNRFSAIQL